MAPLFDEIRALIVTSLHLEDIRPEDIDVNAPLFAGGLGLDSIDALEIGVALQRRYGLTLSADSEDSRRHFASVASLARLVSDHRSR
jgi:acyl carrier protein